MLFAEYQCCSANMAELDDPAMSLYEEAGILSPNRLLDGDSPAERINHGDFRAVVGLIEAFADGIVVGSGLVDDADLFGVVDEVGTTRLDGLFYWHTAPHRDALSGAGSRTFRGRWNPIGTEARYLARPREACLAESRRMAEGQGNGTGSFLPRSVHTIAVAELDVVDPRGNDNLSAVGLPPHELAGPWEPCQRVGNVVDTLGIGGLLAPSATGIDRGRVDRLRPPRTCGRDQPGAV